MTNINHVTIEVADVSAAQTFYDAALGLGELIRVAASETPSTGFRGFTLSAIVGQPSTVQSLVDSAVAAGATILKPAEKSMWGFGGAVRAPDGTVVTVATSNKKEIGPATRTIDSVVLLLGVNDVKASKQFYVDHGLTVGKSFGSYAEFEMPGSPISLALYKRKALAKTAGLDEAGTGSHRLLIGGDSGEFVDPDGFVWVPQRH